MKLLDKRYTVYKYYDNKMNLLYVGISKSAMTRAGQHETDKSWYYEVEFSHWVTCKNRESAEKLEQELIHDLNPKYNKQRYKTINKDRKRVHKDSRWSTEVTKNLRHEVDIFKDEIKTLKAEIKTLSNCKRYKVGGVKLKDLALGVNDMVFDLSYGMMEFYVAFKYGTESQIAGEDRKKKREFWSEHAAYKDFFEDLVEDLKKPKELRKYAN